MLLSHLSPYRKLAWLVLFFLLVGEIMLFSATGVLGIQRHGSEFYFIIRQTACAVLGLGLMIGVSRVPYQWWSRIAYPALAIQIVLVALTLGGPLSHHALGASRWLNLRFIAFQPSELAKVTLTFYLARLLSLPNAEQVSCKKWGIRLVPALTLLLLIFRQPDLGTTVLLATITLGLFFLAGLRLSILLWLGTICSVLFGALMFFSDYRRRRLFAFMDPWADPQGSGFQTIQSFLSFHSGKWFGVGLGNGNSKLFFLPEVHTDFIFALLGEETGFVGAAVVLALFVYFIYLLFKASLHAPDAFGKYLAFGLALSFALQIAVNLGGVTGLLPVKGLPLPFLSWGRSALLVNLAMMGILLNIIRQTGILPPTTPTKAPCHPKK